MTKNDTEVLNSLQQRYDNTNPHFLWSPNFGSLIETYSRKINEDHSKKFVHIQNFAEELKQYKAKPLKHLLRSCSQASTSPSDEPLSKRAKLEGSFSEVHQSFHTKSCTLIPLSSISRVQPGVNSSASEVKDSHDVQASYGDKAGAITPLEIEQRAVPAPQVDQNVSGDHRSLKQDGTCDDSVVIIQDSQPDDVEANGVHSTEAVSDCKPAELETSHVDNCSVPESSAGHVSQSHIRRLESLLEVCMPVYLWFLQCSCQWLLIGTSLLSGTC